MPSQYKRADGLREYLTGASSDGGVQTDPDASLGNCRSSTEAQSMDVVITNPIGNITIDFASGGNEVGDGTLDVVGDNTLRWKCAGGEYGSNVNILNGETKVVETSGSPGAYLRVTRTSAVALSGSATITLSRRANNLFGMDDVTSEEAEAGDVNYRSTIMKNVSSGVVTLLKRWIGELGTAQVSDDTQLGASGAGTIVISGSAASFEDWPEEGFCHIKNGETTREIVYYSERTTTELTVPATGRGLLGTTPSAGAATDTLHAVPGIAIAIDSKGVYDPEGSGGPEIQTLANEDTPPTGVAWNTGITAATGLDIGEIPSGYQVGIQWKREMPEDTVATEDAEVLVERSFDIS